MTASPGKVRQKHQSPSSSLDASTPSKNFFSTVMWTAWRPKSKTGRGMILRNFGVFFFLATSPSVIPLLLRLRSAWLAERSRSLTKSFLRVGPMALSCRMSITAKEGSPPDLKGLTNLLFTGKKEPLGSSVKCRCHHTSEKNFDTPAAANIGWRRSTHRLPSGSECLKKELWSCLNVTRYRRHSTFSCKVTMNNLPFITNDPITFPAFLTRCETWLNKENTVYGSEILAPRLKPPVDKSWRKVKENVYVVRYFSCSRSATAIYR